MLVVKPTDVVLQVDDLVFSLPKNIFQVLVVSVQSFHVVFQGGHLLLEVKLTCFEVDDFLFEVLFHSLEGFVPVF